MGSSLNSGPFCNFGVLLTRVPCYIGEPKKGSFRKLSISSTVGLARFPSNPLIITVPFFLIVGFKKETQPNKQGKRVLLRNHENPM